MAGHVLVAVMLAAYMVYAVVAIACSPRRHQDLEAGPDASGPPGRHVRERAARHAAVEPARLRSRSAILTCQHRWWRERVLVPTNHGTRLVEWSCRQCGALSWDDNEGDF